MNRNRTAAAYGSADDEVRHLIAAFAQLWATSPPGGDPVAAASELIARRRRGARQLTDGAVLTLATTGLIDLSRQATTDPAVMLEFHGAARVVNRFRSILDDAGEPAAFESLLPLAEQALDEELPDPETVDMIAGLGLYSLWRASLA